MRWEIHFDVPDDVDRLVPNERKKYLTGKLTECIHQLIVNEAINSVERDVLSVKPIIYREIMEQNDD
jgi:hypothetical protein